MQTFTMEQMVAEDAGSAIAQAIIASVAPNYDGASHQGNWPPSATFAVDYVCKDRQFPGVGQDRCTEYFDTYSAFEAWVASKHDWIKGTDYDFSLDYTLYEWDLGPNVKDHGHL